MKTKGITVHNISKSFEGIEVLKEVSYVFKEEEITCIMGASGVGKSTFLNLLLGLCSPDQGEILLPEGFLFSAVFQEDRLCESFDAITNVLMVMSNGMTSKDVEEEFACVGLTEYHNKPVSQLSGGMRRRVAIVRAMVTKSNAVVLDEPFQGLNEELKHQVIGYVKDRLRGKIGIVVTHDPLEANALSAKILCLWADSSALLIES